MVVNRHSHDSDGAMLIGDTSSGQIFPAMKNDLILRAAAGQRIERAPVWIMRQAGRYLPEFRALREQHTFFEMCRTPELACAVTLQPINRFDGLLDAAIIFSDILVVLQAIGLVVEMKPGVGPHIPQPLSHPDDLKLLNSDDAVARLQYVMDAITLTRHRLQGRVPLIGFTGAPWTLMSYAIEGGGSKTMSLAKRWLYVHRNESKSLLSLLADVNIDYLVAQVKAGAQMLQVFESHAGYLTRDLFTEFCLPFLTRMADEVKRKLRAEGIDPVPMTIFAKDGHYALDLLAQIGSYDIISLDWTIEADVARRTILNTCQSGVQKTLQGNMDPCQLYGDEESIDAHVKRMCDQFGTQRWIANLGHGIYPDIDPDHVETYLKAIHRHSRVQ